MINMRRYGIAFPPISIKLKLLIFLIPSILVLFGISMISDIKITQKTILEHMGHEVYYSGLSMANEIETFMQSSQKIALDMANTIEIASQLNDNFINKLLKINVKKNSDVYGSTISLSPGSTRLGHYAPYYYRKGKDIKYKSLTSSYDYTKWDWFRIPMETGRASWGEPYYDEGGGDDFMVTFSAPIFRDSSQIGVATVDINLDNLMHKMQSMRVDNEGYALLLSKKGYIISHPDKKLLLKKILPEQINGFQKRSVKELPELMILSELMISAGVRSKAITDPFTGKESWIIAMPIKSAGWTLGIVYPYNEIMRKFNNVQYLLGILFLIIAALMVVIMLWISSTITSPVSTLVRQTERYAEGDFKDRLDETKGSKEIQKLSNAFNVMGGAIEEKIKELRDTQREIVFRLALASEYRDTDTGMHIKRMSHYCAVLGKAYGLDDEECDLLLHASSMHDIGKIGIADAVLLKKGKLESDEWKMMQTHVQIGEDILSGGSSRLIQMAQVIASAHHERWDGSGYPRGIKGDEIPIVGRIACICDVFDSLTTERPYKKAWTVEEALNEIKANNGKIFDPNLVELFIRILPDILDIKNKFAE